MRLQSHQFKEFLLKFSNNYDVGSLSYIDYHKINLEKWKKEFNERMKFTRLTFETVWLKLL